MWVFRYARFIRSRQSDKTKSLRSLPLRFIERLMFGVQSVLMSVVLLVVLFTSQWRVGDERRVQPQAEQNLGIRRSSSGLAFDREYAVRQFAQVALFDKRDDGACLIVGGQHLVECQHPHHNLITTGDSQPRRPLQQHARLRLVTRRIRPLRIIKQPPLHHDFASAPP